MGEARKCVLYRVLIVVLLISVIAAIAATRGFREEHAMTVEIKSVELNPNPVRRGQLITARVHVSGGALVESVIVKTTIGQEFSLLPENSGGGPRIFAISTRVPPNAATGPEPLTIEVVDKHGNVLTTKAVLEVR